MKIIWCEVKFKISPSNLQVKLHVLLQDLIHYSVYPLALSVDHPLSKHYENNTDFVKFKKECSITELQRVHCNAEK